MLHFFKICLFENQTLALTRELPFDRNSGKMRQTAGSESAAFSSLTFDLRVGEGVLTQFSDVCGVICVHSGVWFSTHGPRYRKGKLEVLYSSYNSIFLLKQLDVTNFVVVVLLSLLFSVLDDDGWTSNLESRCR